VIDVEAFSCQELVELVTDYLEGALSIADMRRFEAHIGGCDGCTEYVTQFRRVIQLSGTLTPDDLTPEAESALLEVFRSWNTAETDAVGPEG
jgi:anti-sigma factor RsiW